MGDECSDEAAVASNVEDVQFGLMVRFAVPHDPSWKAAFSKEADAIRSLLGQRNITLHHIGSTAIPNIFAKPIIDLLGTVGDLRDLDSQSATMESLGYEAMGAYGIEERRYFRKTDGSGKRTHHLHVFANGSPHIERYLAFRDYLRSHPENAAEYSNLKVSLTAGKAPSWETYTDGKDTFISVTEVDAIRWYRQNLTN